MCGRFSLSTDTATVTKAFELETPPLFEPRFNMAPSQPVPCVKVCSESRTRELVHLHWGFVPPWAKDPSVGNRMINARSETVAERPTYRHALRRRRCLVVADGFYEWKKVGDGKQPHFIYLKSKQPFGFAGLYEHWQDEHGNELDLCTILTCPANEFMAALHDRMPVMIPPEEYEFWLDPDNQNADAIVPFLLPYPADQMAEHTVSSFVNRPGNDAPRCVESAEGEMLF